MTIWQLLITLFLMGVGLYLFNTYWTAIDPTFKKLINVVVVVIAVLIILYAFGLLPLADRPVPKLQ